MIPVVLTFSKVVKELSAIGHVPHSQGNFARVAFDKEIRVVESSECMSSMQVKRRLTRVSNEKEWWSARVGVGGADGGWEQRNFGKRASITNADKLLLFKTVAVNN